MNIPLFMRSLPDLYHDWGLLSVQPRTDSFRQLLSQVPGMTTPSIMQLLNCAVACLAPGEAYCEVGCAQGTTLLGAMLGHPYHAAYAAHDFPQSKQESQHQLLDNIQTRGSSIQFYNRTCTEFLDILRTLRVRIGVYCYRGARDYEATLRGLQTVVALLADQALIVVDDSHDGEMQRAIQTFLATQPTCQLLCKFTTPHDDHGSFWRGLTVLSWGRTGQLALDRLPYGRHHCRPTQSLWDLSYRSRLLTALESCQRLVLAGCRPASDTDLLAYLQTFAHVTVLDTANGVLPLVSGPDYDGILWYHGPEYLDKPVASALIQHLQQQLPVGIVCGIAAQAMDGRLPPILIDSAYDPAAWYERRATEQYRSVWWASDFTELGLDWRYFGPGDYKYFTNYLIGYWGP